MGEGSGHPGFALRRAGGPYPARSPAVEGQPALSPIDERIIRGIAWKRITVEQALDVARRLYAGEDATDIAPRLGLTPRGLGMLVGIMRKMGASVPVYRPSAVRRPWSP